MQNDRLAGGTIVAVRAVTSGLGFRGKRGCSADNDRITGGIPSVGMGVLTIFLSSNATVLAGLTLYGGQSFRTDHKSKVTPIVGRQQGEVPHGWDLIGTLMTITVALMSTSNGIP